jgi:uncharacterized protein YqjF (DUF2071 family)
MPRRPWAMSMVWEDLLFMHWPIDPKEMRKIVPDQFELDLFDGQAWLGVVPFRMSGVRPRCFPAIPGMIGKSNPSCFLELNVRTYVKVNGKAGVLFFSLDAESKLAVRAARRFFHLPYFDARMACTHGNDGWFDYECRRTHANAPSALFRVRYRPTPDCEPESSVRGSLAHFLTERYCLFVLNKQRQPLVGEIHHEPWPLRNAEVMIQHLDMTKDLGIELGDLPHCSHFAKRLHVVAWLNQHA